MIDRLIDDFDLLAEAPNGVAEIRRMILQLAVQGRLIPQDPKDEPASILLALIGSQRDLLVTAGKIAQEEPLPPVKCNEELCAIPNTWRWVRLRELAYELGQMVPDGLFTYIDVGAINKENGVISEDCQILSPDEAPSRARKIVDIGTVIYSTVRPYLLNIAIIDREFDPPPIVSTAFFVLHPYDGVSNRYLYYYLRSQPFIDYVNDAMKGMAYPAVNDGKMSIAPIPVPPAAEQKRIVAKVDQLMTLCDELEARQKLRTAKRVALNSSCLHALTTAQAAKPFATGAKRILDNFTTLYGTPETGAELRHTILQLAIQGKLVRQDPCDEPASILLEKIKRERNTLAKEGRINRSKQLQPAPPKEVPYELPVGWAWCHLDDLIVDGPQNGYSPRPVAFPTDIKVLALSATTKGVFDPDCFKYVDEDPVALNKYWLRDGDLLFQRGNTPEYVGVPAVYHGKDREFVFPDLMIRVRLTPHVDLAFGHIALLSPVIRDCLRSQASGTSSSMVKINQAAIRRTVFPLPPLTEQRRIVAKVDQLMALYDELETKLTQAQADAETLAASIVHYLCNPNTDNPKEVAS